MLRITILDGDEATRLTLEGRLAGPWAEELRRSFDEWVLLQSDKKLIVDVTDLTYADAAGKQVLNKIYAETNADFVTSSPWNQYLATEVMNTDIDRKSREA